MYYAQITGGIVTSVTETSGAFDQPDMIELQSMDVSLLGHSYANGVFTPPAPQQPSREVTKREWRLLFTALERPPIDRFNAKFESDPALTEAQRDDVRSGLEDYKAASVVNKDDPATAQMLGLYVALGLLAPNRPAEILA